VAANSVQELIALAKANPGRLTYGSGGVGSTPHLAGELFKSLAGIDALHVPYKGGAPALNDLIGGQLSFMIENVPGTMPFAKAGKHRRRGRHAARDRGAAAGRDGQRAATARSARAPRHARRGARVVG
jgi:tripartite-type tricarboxylate transporter receptor subunit TctC